MSRKLLVSFLLTVLGFCSAQVAQGELITQVAWRNSVNVDPGAPRLVPEGLQVGSPVFVDRINVNNRTTRYAVIPEFLLGLEYVMLANNDRSTPNFELDITLARRGTLYLFIDNRVGDDTADNPPAVGGGVMQWVIDMGFTSTYEQVGLDEKNQGNIDRWSTVYNLDVPAGTTTLREQNNGASRNMYAVAAWAPSPTASNPMPEDGAVDVPIDAILGWTPGADARSHDVYLGTVAEDVGSASRTNTLGVLVSQNQDADTLDPVGQFEFGQTYYWRVDDVAADKTIAKGTVWRFDTEPEAYPIAGDLIVATASSYQAGSGPEKTVNGSGLDDQDGHSVAAAAMWQTATGATGPAWIQYAFDRAYKLDEMWVWNYNGDLEFLVGFGLKEVTVEYSPDGATWTVLGNFTFAQGSSVAGYTANTTVDFGGAAAQYVRLMVNSSWASTAYHGLSEVRFLYVPTYARQPQPISGATEVDPDVVLSWRAGRGAVSHNVLVSTDQQAVAGGTVPVITVGENRASVPGLDLGRTYYWKVNEVNAAEPVASWEGEVWEFSTQDSYVVDDFETYNDGCNRVYYVWKSGASNSENPACGVSDYGGNGTGSTVGNAIAPYAERRTVHGGWQSMPFSYANVGAASLSEAVRTFDPAQDWTRGGAKALVLYFQGGAENTGRLYVKINGIQVVYDGDAADLAKPFWIQWTIDLTKVGADLKQVRTMTIGVDNGGSGMLFFDDIRLYREAPQQAKEEVWVEAEAADSIVGLMNIYSDRADASGGQYVAAFGENSANIPQDDAHPGVVRYTVRLAGGTYRIIGRVIAPTGNDDSFWVHFEGATTNTTNDVSGWIRWGLVIGEAWHDVPVRSMDDADQTVLFTVGAGIYSLEIAYREDGALLDAWMITKQLE